MWKGICWWVLKKGTNVRMQALDSSYIRMKVSPEWSTKVGDLVHLRNETLSICALGHRLRQNGEIEPQELVRGKQNIRTGETWPTRFRSQTGYQSDWWETSTHRAVESLFLRRTPPLWVLLRSDPPTAVVPWWAYTTTTPVKYKRMAERTWGHTRASKWHAWSVQ